MPETETSTPDSGPASAPITLDGVLESAIGSTKTNGELAVGETQPTPEPMPLAGESSAEEVEVPVADPSDDAAEDQAGSETEGTPQTEVEPEPQSLAAPTTWPAEQREAFEQLPDEQRDFMLKREHERDAAFTRKTTELAEQRKAVEGITGVLQPYEDQMRAHGVQPAEYVARLMSYDTALRQNPKLALQHLAQHYGVPLESRDSDANWEPEASASTDPQFQQLQQQLAQTQQHVQSLEQSQHQERYQQLVSQVDSFATEKTKAGELKHPHFERVRERMGRLVNTGETKDLDTAYTMALRLDDELFKETLAAERKSVTTKEEDRRKAAVDRAKRAQPSRSANPPSGSVKESDLDSILRATIGGSGAG